MELFRIYQSIDSTNEEASRLLLTSQNLHGTALMAYHQSEGRGQYGRPWHGEKGSHLAMSIIVQPSYMLPEELPSLSLKTSLALRSVLKKTEPSLDPKIKWPNDVLIHGKKIAGILIENSLSGSKVKHSIIGIGMNVNETSFPEEIPNAVSLSMITGKTYDLKQIGMMVREEVMKILEEERSDWKQEYDLSIFGLNQLHAFTLNGNEIKATMMGVDMDGKIILLDDSRKRKSYFSHEIKWIL